MLSDAKTFVLKLNPSLIPAVAWKKGIAGDVATWMWMQIPPLPLQTNPAESYEISLRFYLRFRNPAPAELVFWMFFFLAAMIIVSTMRIN